MHRSRLCTVVIDCQVENIDKAAVFWSRALGKSIVPPSEPSNYRELATERDELILLLQKVEHPSRVHLDIETDDIEAEVKRLEALGAKRLEFIQRWWVMQSPTGQRFCVVQPQRGLLDQRSNAWTDDGKAAR